MIDNAFYIQSLQYNAPLKSTIGSIEELLHFPSHNSLERQVTEIKASEEPEDPPEALHRPWGVWLHHWNALHRIDQKYDTTHVLRTANYAMDILHYANYVPVIGDNEHKIETYEMNFEYDYLHEEPIYGINIEFEEEDFNNTGIVFDADNVEDAVNSNSVESLDNNEEKNLVGDVDKSLKSDVE